MASDKELERVLKAAGNRKRIGILKYLKGGPANVGDIASAIKLSIKATSHHLQQLSAAGYVTSEQRGLYVIYKLEAEGDAQRIIRAVF